MPGHYGSHEHNLVSVSSPVATQLLHAVGIALAAKIRKTGQVAMTSMGEGSSNQGDVHEGLNFAAIHKLPFIFVVENNGYAISVPLARSRSPARASRSARPATGSRASSSTAPTSSPATRPPRTAVERARAGDGPTLIEAKVTAAHRPLVRRPADEVPLRGGAGGREGPRPAAAVPGPARRRRRPDRRGGGDDRRRDQGDGRRRDRLRRERSRTPIPSTAMKWVYAEDWPGETPPPWGFGGRRRGGGQRH